MKLQSFATLVLMILLLTWMSACNKENTAQGVKDLSPYAQKFLGLNTGGINASNSRAAAINQSYNGAINTAQTLSGNTSGSSDSSVVGEPWHTCATVTETDNPDGSHTITYDYGLGCNDGYGDFKNFVMGKTIQTSLYNAQHSGSLITSTYAYQYQYINYGGRTYYNNDSTEWGLNGKSSYSGVYSYDSVTYAFSGWYNYSDTTDYHYGKDTYSYKTLGKSTYDKDKAVTDKNDYEYTNGDNYYKAVVTVPLVSSYTCYQNTALTGTMMAYWITYVSGHEIIQYRQDGQEGTFEIDYGNGECDNIIIVIENGKRVVVDLTRDYPVLAAAAAQH
jgi:hypothetical protein